ncbi:hypothetical protein ACOME3_005891 [Neoechinorhynchus agilis]
MVDSGESSRINVLSDPCGNRSDLSHTDTMSPDLVVKSMLEKCYEYSNNKLLQIGQYKQRRRSYKAFFTAGRLRWYQKVGLHWYRKLFDNQMNGILADEASLGKTIQTIAFVCDVLARERNGPFLIVCQKTLFNHWIVNFKRFAPHVKCIVAYGSTKEARAASKSKFSRSLSSQPMATTIQVLLTAYEIIRQDKKFFQNIAWKIVFVDARNRPKTSYSKPLETLNCLDTESRFIVSESPPSEKLNELFIVLEFLMPVVFKEIAIPDFHNAVKSIIEPTKHFENQRSENSQHLSKMDKRAISEMVIHIHEIISYFTLRRFKSDVESIRTLPLKIVKTIEIRMHEDQIRLLEHFLEPEMVKRNGLQRIWSIVQRLALNPQLIDEDDVPIPHKLSLDACETFSGSKFRALGVLLTRFVKENRRIAIFVQCMDTMDLLQKYCVRILNIQVSRIDAKMSISKRNRQLLKFNDREVAIMLLNSLAAKSDLNLNRPWSLVNGSRKVIFDDSIVLPFYHYFFSRKVLLLDNENYIFTRFIDRLSLVLSSDTFGGLTSKEKILR